MNESGDMHFGVQAMLWVALLVAPCLVAFFVWAWRRKQAAMAAFVPVRLFETLLLGYSARREKIRFVLLGLAVFFTLLALAKPRWGFALEEVQQRGLDMVVAIDTSRSMLAPDLPPNRLERAKLACYDLLKQARTDRLGLVAFAGSAFLQCPLTFDNEAFRLSLSAVDTKIIPQGGTALAEAIRTATEAFKTEENNYKILILLTDGEDHDSGAVEAAKEAAKHGVKIFTIGVGTPGGELLSYTDENGQQAYIRDDAGNIVRSKLDENMLREIATVGGGFYLPLSGAKTMETLYEKGLAPLPKSESSSKFIRRYQERFQWPLAVVIVLLLIEWLLQTQPEHDAKKLKTSSVTAANGHKVAVAVSLIWIYCASSLSASPATAERAFQSGDYKSALQEYQQLLKEHPDDPRLHYNAATSAYRAKDYETAVRGYDDALRTPDLELQRDAYYNRGNTRFRQGEKTDKLEDKQQLWEESLSDYERALKLNPQDKDAGFNRDLVKRKLEELKKQQQQQQKQNGDKKDDKQNKDDKDQKDQKQKQNQQDKKNQSSKQDQQQKQNGDKQQQQSQQKKQDEKDQSKNGQQKTDPQKEQSQQAKQQGDQNPSKPGQDQQAKNQQGQGQKPGQQKPDGKQGGQAMMAQGNGEMTPQQAKQLLDAIRAQEKALIFQPPEGDPKNQPQHIKNW